MSINVTIEGPSFTNIYVETPPEVDSDLAVEIAEDTMFHYIGEPITDGPQKLPTLHEAPMQVSHLEAIVESNIRAELRKRERAKDTDPIEIPGGESITSMDL